MGAIPILGQLTFSYSLIVTAEPGVCDFFSLILTLPRFILFLEKVLFFASSSFGVFNPSEYRWQNKCMLYKQFQWKPWDGGCSEFQVKVPCVSNDRPFAQLLPELETGHPVTVGQSPAYESHREQSETETRKTAFCSSETLKSNAGDWPTVTGCPSLTQAIIVQMVYSSIAKVRRVRMRSRESWFLPEETRRIREYWMSQQWSACLLTTPRPIWYLAV